MMEILDYLLELPWVQPLGWTLVHFLWQGAAIGLAAGIAFRVSHCSSPRLRYALGLCALFACVLAPIATFLVLAKPFSVPKPQIVTLGNATEARSVLEPAALGPQGKTPAEPTISLESKTTRNVAEFRTPKSAPGNLQSYGFPDVVSWIVPVWLLCVCVLTLRLGVAWMRIQLWRRNAWAPADDQLISVSEQLAGALDIKRRIPILLSSVVPGPLTLGFLKPVILLPAQLLSGLPPEQIEALLAHELAHIRRHDYVINLLQAVVEVVLFYHPVVWWLNRQIRLSREECCDELAAAACDDRMTYAQALASLAELQAGLQPALGARDGDLVTRIRKILGRPKPDPIFSGRNAAWFMCLLIAVLTAWGIILSSKLIAAEQIPMANTKNAPQGTVVDESGKPVAAVEVILYHAKNYWGIGNKVIARVQTDSTGHFAFKEELGFECPNGTDNTDHYALFALAESFAPAWHVIVGGTHDEGEYRLKLTKPVEQTYEVFDKGGQPIKGATVWLRYAGAQSNKPPFFAQSVLVPENLDLCSATTDELGRATLKSLPDTTYSVAASKPGCEDSMSCTTPKEGVPKFTLVPAATLEGRVTDPLGMPVEGAIVWLYPKFKWHQYFMAKTDADGRYRIEKIWSNGDQPDWGKYEVGIRHPRFTAKTAEIKFTSDQHLTGFDIAAEPGVLLKGALLDPGTDKPVAGGSVIVDSASGRQGLKSDRDGNFQCRVIAGDTTVIASEAPGGCYFVEERSGEFPSDLRTRTFGKEFGAKVYLGGPVGKLGRLSGSVFSSDGEPAVRCSVKTVPLARILRTTPYFSGAWREGYTNESGQFESPYVPIGLPFVVVAETLDGKTAGLGKGDMEKGEQELGAPIRLEPTGTVKATMLDGSDKPRANAEVKVTPVLEETAVYTKEKNLKSNAQGLLTIPGVIPGIKYHLELAGTQASDVTMTLLSADGIQGASQVVLSDKYLVRLEDATGRSIPIAKFKEYWVWILSEGKRVRWTNDGKIPIVSNEPDGVIVPRTPFLLGRGGDQVDTVIETGEGKLVKATGSLPDLASNPLIFRMTEDLSTTGYRTDPSLKDVGSAEIVGRVLNGEGKPIPKATISTANNRIPGGLPGVETDAEGVFRKPLEYGQPPLYLMVLADGYAPAFLTDCPVGSGFVVTLQNTTRLKGIVAGSHPGKVKIRLEKDKPTKRQGMDFLVRGLQFRTESLPDGTYDFLMEPGEYRYQLQSEDGRFARGEISLHEGETKSFPKTLEQGVSAELQLIDSQTGKPIPEISVEITEKLDAFVTGNKAGSERVSDSQGIVKWDNLMPGETEFSSWRMFRSIGTGKQQLPYVRWWREEEPVEWRQIGKMAPTRRQGVDPIFVDVQADTKPVRVLMERGVRVSGTVVGTDGQPLEGVSVGVVPNEGMRATLTGDSRFSFVTDKKGDFEGYLPAGNGVVYNLCAYTWPEKTAPFANAVSEPFSSKPGDEFSFDLRMSAGAYVSGIVLGSDGKPVTGMEVQATNCDFRDSAYADRLTKTDMNGRFRVGPLRAGEYLIQPDTSENVNIASIPGFTPPKIDVADGEEKDVGDIALPIPSRQGNQAP